MHKSKNYDMATQVAMDKLMPKPIQISISMKGGGGLSSINKPISINGKRHNLAWINSDEASVLKAMGGSGKKGPMGIPSYQETDEYDYSVVDSEPATVEMYDMGFTETVPGYFTHETEPEDIGNIITYTQPYTPVATSDSGDTWQEERAKIIKSSGTGGGRGADPRAFTYYREPIEDKGPAGGVPYYGGSDPLTKEDFLKGRHSNKLNPYINALYASGMITDQVGDYLASLSPSTLAGMREAYDTGYSFGGPMGTMRGLSRDQGTDYEKKLKLKKFAKELQDLKDKNLSQEELDKQKGELFSKYQDIAKEFGANITENKRFKGMYSGLEEEAAKREGFMPKVIGAAAKYNLLPGSFATAGLAGIANLLTDLFGVVGEFTTKEGQSYRLMEDGTLVEPDIYTPSQSDNDPMASIQKPRPVRQASVSEEVDKPFTGIAALQQERSEVASISERLQPQFDNIASIFGREKAAEMLGQPENIFA